MALKPDRHEAITDLSYFATDVTERGVIMVHDTSGSGAALDQSDAVVAVATGTAGDPAGLLLNDIVDVDLTRTHLNHLQDEVQSGGKVLLLRRGWVVTDQIKSGDTPTAGNDAHFDANGELTTTTTSAKVGKFLSSKDEDGYAKVDINIVE